MVSNLHDCAEHLSLPFSLLTFLARIQMVHVVQCTQTHFAIGQKHVQYLINKHINAQLSKCTLISMHVLMPAALRTATVRAANERPNLHFHARDLLTQNDYLWHMSLQ